jgi:hypothetical protein
MNPDERLTWKQICKRYPEQWVVLVDHDWQRHNVTEYKTARVIAIGSTRSEAKASARPLLDAFYEWGCHFTGPIQGPRFGYRTWPLA